MTRTASNAVTGDIGALSVKNYGAAGNGVVDDTAALQAAINAAVASGAELLVPAGTYQVSAPLTVKGRLALRGVGDASTLRAAANIAAILQDSSGARGVYDLLRFDGAGKATNCVQQTVASETSVGTRWYRCKFTGATDYQMINNGCEDVTYLDCATDGNESAPGTVPHALSVYVPNGNARIIGGTWFGAVKLNMQIAVVYGATIGPVVIDNPGARTDSVLKLDGCYVYDGGVDSSPMVGTSTNLCNMVLSGCYLAAQVQKNYVSGNLPAGVTVRFADCTFVQTPGLGASPVSYALNASGAGRLVLDGGQAALVAGGVLHAFNAVAAATTTTTTVVPVTGLT